MSAHHLQHKGPLVAKKQEENYQDRCCNRRPYFVKSWPLSCGHDGVHHLNDPVQRRVGANGHVGAAEVVVDGSDHANNVERWVPLSFFLIDQTWKTTLDGVQSIKTCMASKNLPFLRSSSNRPLHSSRNRLAPVRLPSPPITHRLVMLRFTRLCAAFRRPSRVRNSLQRALPMTVPPWGNHRILSSSKCISAFNLIYMISMSLGFRFVFKFRLILKIDCSFSCVVDHLCQSNSDVGQN